MEEQNAFIQREQSAFDRVTQLVQSDSQESQTVGTERVEYAGFWVRFAAALVDGLVLAIPSAVIQGIFGKSLGGLLGYVLMWGYAIYMLNTRQATLGKMAVGLKVVTTDGSGLGVGKLILREVVGKILDVLTLSIGYLMVAFTEKKQGLHDKIASTVVIYDPTRKRRSWIVVIAIMFAVALPIGGIFVGIFLASMGSAKEKAQQKAAMSYAFSILPEIILCEDDGGNVNAYASGRAICDAPNHGSVTWPDMKSSGYRVNANAAKNADLKEYSFILSKDGASSIVCSVASGKCE